MNSLKTLETIIAKTGSLKTIICGPHHSGKSVFVLNLLQRLSRQKAYCFRACPDGEGDWSGFSDQVLVESIRKKGQFNEKFLRFALGAIQNTRKPIFLVDVGGKIDDKNRCIFCECNAFIIVSSDKDETAKWRAFGEKCGLVCLAELDSVLEGEDEIFDDSLVPLKARVTKLERGKFPNSKTIHRVAMFLDGMTQGLEDKSSATIVLDELASSIGVIKEPRGFNWQGKDLHFAVGAISYLKTIKQIVTIDGGGAGFVYAALVHAVHPATAKIRDPKLKEYVKIPLLKMANSGSDHLKWKIEDRGSYTFMEFSFSCPSGVFDVADLPYVIVPEAPQEKGIVVSGKGPNWLTVAIVMAYRDAAWTALFRPQDAGAIVVVCNIHNAPQLGEVIRNIYPIENKGGLEGD